MKVLVINTYGGSILIAAKRRRDEIVASMEDSGYGIPIQQANFPELNYYPNESDWPTWKNAKDLVVCAHPPCAAFSSQNRGSAAHRGANSPKAQCTVRVMQYALSQGVLSLAIESVPGACEGLRSFHDEYAKRYGYDVYRIFLNAASLGVPQYRRRFWTIFIRRGVVQTMSLVMQPKRKTVGDVINNSIIAPEFCLRCGAGLCQHRREGEGTCPACYDKCLTVIPWVEEHTQEQLERIRQALGRRYRGYLNSQTGSVVRTLAEYGGYKRHKELTADVYTCPCEACRETRRSAMGWNFTSHSMVMLGPNDLAPVLLAGSWWFYRTRALYQEEYKEVMDFPRDYIFPGDYYLNRTREYLSRGVCPATAEWILEQIDENVNRQTYSLGHSQIGVKIETGQVADFRLSAKARHVALDTEVSVV